MTVSDPVRIVDSVTIQVDLTNPSNEQPLLVDSLVGALATIDTVHHEVHEGHFFHAEHSASVANGNNLDVQILTGANNDVHMTAVVAAGGQCLVYLYEAPTTNGGTALTSYNMLRSDTTHTAPWTAVHTPTVTSVGTTPLINGRLIPGGTATPSRVGGETRSSSEWILKANTKYLLRVNNNSGGNIVIHVTAEGYTV